jgi:hypothetical protein
MAGGLITPDELRRIAEQKEMEELQKALEKKKQRDHEHDELRESFMQRDIHPEVFDRLTRAVKGAAERGEKEIMVLRFSSDFCTDRGRAINNFEPNWPDTLTGFAKKAYEFYVKELEQHGYKLRAQIMDYPGGVPGDVGIFLKW